ncbi:hypothetical protein D3C86_1398070 [compost metagenome]
MLFTALSSASRAEISLLNASRDIIFVLTRASSTMAEPSTVMPAGRSIRWRPTQRGVKLEVRAFTVCCS